MMKLQYVVITMVDRDDLADGGAAHVAKVITTVKELNPGIKVELLAGDFNGSDDALRVILKTRPEVYAHNIETVARLSPRVRDGRANYQQSLRVLRDVKKLANYHVFTKSALMLGLGEAYEEVVDTFKDLRRHEVDFMTLGQYMRPSKKHLAIKEWVKPEIFTSLGEEGKRLGFLSVASAPLVRSSYRAHQFYNDAVASLQAKT